MLNKCDGSTREPMLPSMSGCSPSRTSTIKISKHQHRGTTATTATKLVNFIFISVHLKFATEFQIS